MAITPPIEGSEHWYVGRSAYVNPPTIAGSTVGLPANTIYIDPNTGRIYRTT